MQRIGSLFIGSDNMNESITVVPTRRPHVTIFSRHLSQNVKRESSLADKKTQETFISLCSGKELSVKKAAGRDYELDSLNTAISRDHLRKNVIGTAKICSG